MEVSAIVSSPKYNYECNTRIDQTRLPLPSFILIQAGNIGDGPYIWEITFGQHWRGLKCCILFANALHGSYKCNYIIKFPLVKFVTGYRVDTRNTHKISFFT